MLKLKVKLNSSNGDKVNEMESRRVKQGARSSMTHWMTHIMRKFKQILDYHVKLKFKDNIEISTFE